ncbi:tetratricopeptide repeat protein [Sandaracinus amylolyticus]|uniref:tetratricopeptide repeat protein n=1 Tax=Sandaracinus amylolyticus TaxID=927083 RepID=UPI001F1F4534|nr:tetratricopeptide repeat protein [Sandaracinus amylolyticus]UJR84759.1 Hypothetical protein I5071_68380 [Sandaracinus amylolyticus]
MAEQELEAITAQWDRGDHDGALAALDALIARHGESVARLHQRGAWLAASGRHEAALAAFRRSIAIAPSYPDHYNAGNALLALGRPDDAIAQYDASLALHARHPEAHTNRGIALFQSRRHDEARAAFGAALAIDRDFVPALRCTAILERHLGRMDASEALFRRITTLRPRDLGAALDLADCLAALPPSNELDITPRGRTWRAIEAARAARELAPDDPRPLRLEARVLARAMHVNVSFSIARVRPDGTLAFELERGPLRTASFFDEQVALCEAAMVRFPEDATFPRLLGDAYDLVDRIEDAKRMWQRASELE